MEDDTFAKGFWLGAAIVLILANCADMARSSTPKPELVNLHCRALYGGPDELSNWKATGGEFEAVLAPCGREMTKASCEAAAAAVNDFRPVIKGEGPTGWKLFFAMCAEAQPQTMI